MSSISNLRRNEKLVRPLRAADATTESSQDTKRKDPKKIDDEFEEYRYKFELNKLRASGFQQGDFASDSKKRSESQFLNTDASSSRIASSSKSSARSTDSSQVRRDRLSSMYPEDSNVPNSPHDSDEEGNSCLIKAMHSRLKDFDNSLLALLRTECSQTLITSFDQKSGVRESFGLKVDYSKELDSSTSARTQAMSMKRLSQKPETSSSLSRRAQEEEEKRKQEERDQCRRVQERRRRRRRSESASSFFEPNDLFKQRKEEKMSLLKERQSREEEIQKLLVEAPQVRIIVDKAEKEGKEVNIDEVRNLVNSWKRKRDRLASRSRSKLSKSILETLENEFLKPRIEKYLEMENKQSPQSLQFNKTSENGSSLSLGRKNLHLNAWGASRTGPSSILHGLRQSVAGYSSSLRQNEDLCNSRSELNSAPKRFRPQSAPPRTHAATKIDKLRRTDEKFFERACTAAQSVLSCKGDIYKARSRSISPQSQESSLKTNSFDPCKGADSDPFFIYDAKRKLHRASLRAFNEAQNALDCPFHPILSSTEELVQQKGKELLQKDMIHRPLHPPYGLDNLSRIADRTAEEVESFLRSSLSSSSKSSGYIQKEVNESASLDFNDDQRSGVHVQTLKAQERIEERIRDDLRERLDIPTRKRWKGIVEAARESLSSLSSVESFENELKAIVKVPNSSHSVCKNDSTLLSQNDEKMVLGLMSDKGYQGGEGNSWAESSPTVQHHAPVDQHDTFHRTQNSLLRGSSVYNRLVRDIADLRNREWSLLSRNAASKSIQQSREEAIPVSDHEKMHSTTNSHVRDGHFVESLLSSDPRRIIEEAEKDFDENVEPVHSSPKSRFSVDFVKSQHLLSFDREKKRTELEIRYDEEMKKQCPFQPQIHKLNRSILREPKEGVRYRKIDALKIEKNKKNAREQLSSENVVTKKRQINRVKR